MRACRGTGLVTTVWAIAEIIVHGGPGDLNSRVRDAAKGGFVLVELGNFEQLELVHEQEFVEDRLMKLAASMVHQLWAARPGVGICDQGLRNHVHSGATPRGRSVLPPLARAVDPATASKKSE